MARYADAATSGKFSFTLHYNTLHYIILHCTELHYMTLHYIVLHYLTLQYSTVQYITLHYITLHYITLHYITLHARYDDAAASGKSTAEVLWGNVLLLTWAVTAANAIVLQRPLLQARPSLFVVGVFTRAVARRTPSVSFCFVRAPSRGERQACGSPLSARPVGARRGRIAMGWSMSSRLRTASCRSRAQILRCAWRFLVAFLTTVVLER